MSKLREFVSTNQYKLGYLFAFLIGLTPILWFKGNMLAGEEFYALDYAQWGNIFSDVWSNRQNHGEFSVLTSFKFQQLFFNILYFIGFTKFLALLTWHVSLFVLSSVSFYHLVFTVFKRRVAVLSYILATIYYVYTPYFLNISVYLSPPRILFAFMPLIFLILYWLITNQKDTIFKVFVLTLVLTLVSPIFVNIPLGLPLLGLVLLFLLFLSYFRQYPYIKSASILVFFIATYVLLNLWWILPTAYRQIFSLSDIKGEAATFSTISNSNTVDVLSLFGSWAFREKIFNTDYYYFSYNASYDTFLGTLSRFLPFLIFILGIYSLRKYSFDSNEQKGLVIFALFGYALFIWLSKGVNMPFGFIYKLLYEKLPGFWMFREPYAKFLPFASFFMSFLLIFGFESLVKFTKKNSTFTYLSILLFAALLYTGWPYLNSKIIWDTNDKQIRSHLVQIPQSWQNLSESWNPRAGNYFVPTAQEDQDRYLWPSGYTGDPYLLLTEAKLVNIFPGYSAADNKQKVVINSYLLSSLLTDTQKFKDECPRYDLSGIIFQKDIYVNNSAGLFNEFHTVSNIFDSSIEFENDAAKIISCTSNDTNLFSIVPSRQVIPIKSQFLNFYHILRNTLNKDLYLDVTNQSEDNLVLFSEPTIDGNKVTYDLSAVRPNTDLFIYKNIHSLTNILLDGVNVPINQSKDYININLQKHENCCKNISLQFNESPTTTLNQQISWVQIKRDKTHIREANNIKESELLLNDDYIYLTPLTGFNPKTANFISFDLEAIPFQYIAASIIRVDDTTKNISYISSYQVPATQSSKITLPFNGIENNILLPNENGNYYMAVYGLILNGNNNEKIPYPDNLKIKLKNLQLRLVNLPFVYAINNPSETTSSEVLYKDVTNSIKFVSLTNHKPNNDVLIFKNSYNKDWRLIKIDKEVYENTSTLDTFNLFMKSYNAESPRNIEYYANGWDLSNKSDQYFAVVFWPTILMQLCINLSIISFTLISLIFGYQFWKKRNA